MNKTRIEWCDASWNPVVGCTGACPYCYARKMAHRFHRDFTPHWVEKNFNRAMPKKPSRIFVNSMSDLADWEADWLDWVWIRMALAPEHLFLFLSKRPWDCEWVPRKNAMLGYSITNQSDLISLYNCPVSPGSADEQVGNISFLSIEPLLGPIELSRWLPRWVIVGAETGNRKGKVEPELDWLLEIHEFARARKIPLFFKDSLRHLWPCSCFPQEYPARERGG